MQGPGLSARLARRRLPVPTCCSRKPNTDDLGLDIAGVEPRGYIPVDDELRTGARYLASRPFSVK